MFASAEVRRYPVPPGDLVVCRDSLSDDQLFCMVGLLEDPHVRVNLGRRRGGTGILPVPAILGAPDISCGDSLGPSVLGPNDESTLPAGLALTQNAHWNAD